MKHAIVKFHELALKGKNRPMFIRKLVSNVRNSVIGTGVERVWQGHMLIGLNLSEDADWSEIQIRLKNCFGVAKFFPAHKISRDVEAIKKILSEELPGRQFETFRISAHRSDKRFKITSSDLNRDLGTFVIELTGAKVNLKFPDLEVFIDVLHDGILVYFDELKGYGGMPVGVSGTSMALMSGGIDSPVAAWHMMKRGSHVKFAHFHSHPLVDTSSIEKSIELTEKLTRYQLSSELYLIPFAAVQQRIIVSVPAAYRVVMYRRFMVRISEKLAEKSEALALVTGESLAQVASQTLENISVVDEVSHMPILRPLIGMNKNEIIDISREIDTYDISIMPDQDCCSLFVPRHPVLRGRSDIVKELEESLPVEDMVAESIDGVQVRNFTFPS